MREEIIELLPSPELKATIRETNHRFTENELLQIIHEYAPTFDGRQELLGRFAEIVSPDVSALAKAYMEYEQDTFERFAGASEGFVYELQIKRNPNLLPEKYICASYRAVLACIDRYFEEYTDLGFRETEQTRYIIKKQKLFSEGDTFHGDSPAECMLGPNKTVLKLSDYQNSFEEFCTDKKGICPPNDNDVRFPCFVREQSLVKYSDCEGKKHFAVCLCHSLFEKACDGLVDYLYVLPLDGSTIRDRRFDDGFLDHDHIASPLVSFALPEELDETMRKNYLDFIAYWDSRKKKND